MPFRRSFDCLWCGRPWEVRFDDDLEGWAALCPDCLGKADDNGFLRGRLRTALRDRSAVGVLPAPAVPLSSPQPSPSAPAAPPLAPPAAPAAPAAPAVPPLAPPVSSAPSAPSSPPAPLAPAARDWNDWYLRQGRFSRGPVHDGPWSMELDEATRWLDRAPVSGLIVELGAGMGWWTALLAEKGELWLYDSDGASLDDARKRLMAHGLLAHLHQRDVLAPPDKPVDAVFSAYLLSGAETSAELDTRIAVAMAWLKPGGSFVFVEAQPGPSGSIAGPAGPLWPHDPVVLRERLAVAGFAVIEVGQTLGAFVLGQAQTSA